MNQRNGASSVSKLRLAERLAERRLTNIDHERRVLQLAAALFNLTCKLHELEPQHLLLLKIAALLHDVGRAVDQKRHPAESAKLILNDRRLALDERERRQVAYLTRYHRGAVPEAGYDEILRAGDGRKALRRVLAILRVADTLDSRQLPPPHIELNLRGQKLAITCIVNDHAEKARRAFVRPKKFRLFEDELDCRVDIRLRVAPARERV